MFCSVCGSQLPSEASFCSNCGTQTSQPRRVVPIGSYERPAQPEARRIPKQRSQITIHTRTVIIALIFVLAIEALFIAYELNRRPPVEEDRGAEQSLRSTPTATPTPTPTATPTPQPTATPCPPTEETETRSEFVQRQQPDSSKVLVPCTSIYLVVKDCKGKTVSRKLQSTTCS